MSRVPLNKPARVRRGLSVSLASIRIAAGLLAVACLTAAAGDSTSDCDCACSRYAEQVLSPGSNQVDTGDKVARCGGACAIAWADCEIRFSCGAAPEGVSSTGDQALRTLVGNCSTSEQSGPEPLVLTGNLFYPERIALPPESEAIVELYSGSGRERQLAASRRFALDGEQVPVGFELSVDPTGLDADQRHSLRAGIVSRPGPLRVTAPVEVEARTGSVEIGSLRLRPVPATPFGDAFHCGDYTVVFGELGESHWLAINGLLVEMTPEPAASGARFEAADGGELMFWSKGREAQVRLDGEQLPDCRAVAPPERPFSARGQEPGWDIRIDDEALVLRGFYGEQQVEFRAPEVELTGEGVHYHAATEGDEITVRVEPRICRDSMSGMPHPYTARYWYAGDSFPGCAGQPRSLLTGDWQIERIGDQVVDADPAATLSFLDEEDTIAGQAACNRYSAGFELTGEGLRFGPVAATKMACPEDGQADREARLFEALRRIDRFDIDADGRLLLIAADQTRIVASPR